MGRRDRERGVYDKELACVTLEVVKTQDSEDLQIWERPVQRPAASRPRKS